MVTAVFLSLSTGRAFLSRRASLGAAHLRPSRFLATTTDRRPASFRSGGRRRPTTRNDAALYATAAAASMVTGAAFVVCEENATLFPDAMLEHDTYDGVTVDLEKYVNENGGTDWDPVDFRGKLARSLRFWDKEGRRGIWIRIPTSRAVAVPLCTDLGFDFHCAEKNLLVLTRWLPEGPSRLPPGPTHQVGVGVIALHPLTRRLLVVREKTGPAAARGLWKMPTGLADPGEDAAAAAVRETEEETGLRVEFDRVLAVRQAHGGYFGASDMFFVCLVKLASEYAEGLRRGEEVPLRAQEEEIAEVKWMSVEEYAKQDTWKGSPLYEELNASIMQAANAHTEEERDGCHGMVARTLPVGYRPGSQTIYVPK